MVKVMHDEKGIGLSANQVGLPFRMIVLIWEDNPICLVNPVVRSYGKRKSKQEGCLSFPDIYIDIKRPSKCHITAWTLDGDDIDEEIDGDLARIVQHETDHLDGVLFIDRVSETVRKSRPLSQHLAAMEQAWLQYPKDFPADAFRDILHDYCNFGPGSGSNPDTDAEVQEEEDEPQPQV